jgi:hypothetical protein
MGLGLLDRPIKAGEDGGELAAPLADELPSM